MNYLAHALPFFDDPYFVAGTGVPDWLMVVDRRVRVRSKRARPLLEDPDPRVVAVAGGILQHIRDDARFHNSRAFVELSLKLTAMAGDVLGAEAGFRPSFLGHLLAELLLDASLVTEDPARLETYYHTLASVDVELIQGTVNRIAARQTDRLAATITEFLRRRILSDYQEDGKLLARLNQVMRRVRFDALPEHFLEVLPEARRLVADRRCELLKGIPSEPPAMEREPTHPKPYA